MPEVSGWTLVMAVQADPVNGAVLAAQGSAGGEEALQPLRKPQGPVGEHPVVANGDPEAGRDPIEDQQGCGGLPAPELRKLQAIATHPMRS